MYCYIFLSVMNTFPVCVNRSHQPFSSKDSKPRGVGLKAKVVLTRGMSCEGKFTKFTITFGHQNLDHRKDIVKPTFFHLWIRNIRCGFVFLCFIDKNATLFSGKKCICLRFTVLVLR